MHQQNKLLQRIYLCIASSHALLQKLEEYLYFKQLTKIDPETYRNQRVVVKGCADIPVPEAAYVELIRMLQPVVKSIMYGEPCSTVPVFKSKEKI